MAALVVSDRRHSCRLALFRVGRDPFSPPALLLLAPFEAGPVQPAGTLAAGAVRVEPDPFRPPALCRWRRSASGRTR